MGSENLYDNIDFFTRNATNEQPFVKNLEDFPESVEFEKAQMHEKPIREELELNQAHNHNKPDHIQPNESTQTKRQVNSESGNLIFTGYCIRTREKVKFNLKHPFTEMAFQSWNRYKNADFVEHYCHSCGNSHSTTMNKPLCDSCFYKGRAN